MMSEETPGPPAAFDSSDRTSITISDDNNDNYNNNNDDTLMLLEDVYWNLNSRNNDTSSTSASLLPALPTITTSSLIKSFHVDLQTLAADDPRKAQDSLEQLVHQIHQQQRKQQYFTNYSNEDVDVSSLLLPCYHTVIEGWLDAGRADQSEQLLFSMEQEKEQNERLINHDENNSNNIKITSNMSRIVPAPTSWTYFLVAQGWISLDATNSIQSETGALRAEALLRRLMQKLQHQQQVPVMDDREPKRGQKQDDYDPQQQQQEQQLEISVDVKPSLSPILLDTNNSNKNSVQHLWSLVLDAWCKRAGQVVGAMDRARALLNEMETAYRNYHQHNVTTTTTNNNNNSKTIINENKGPSSTPATTGLVPFPNVLIYTSFLGGLARSKERDLARQAEAVLEERMPQHGVQPDMVAYTSVLNCLAKCTSRRERQVAAVRSLQLLQEMERKYIRQEQYHVKPTLITYATAIRAIGHSLDPQAAELAEAVLGRMYQLHRTSLIANLKPTTQTYNAVVHALSMAAAPSDDHQKLRNAKRAEDILMTMMRLSKPSSEGGNGERDVEPDVRTWAAVLRAWAQCATSSISTTTTTTTTTTSTTHATGTGGAENCQRVLDRMRELYEAGEITVRPNFVCYTTVMGAWGNSRRRDGLEKMEILLKYMEDQYEETLEADVRPNTVSYVTAIDAFVRRNEPDAARRAQATVDRMWRLYAKGLGHVRPTRTIFNCLIHAYSKSKEKGAAQNAEKIFQWMETQSRVDELVRPDGTSLCGVLNAWANQATSEGAERALQIWERMDSLSSQERGFELSIMMPNIVIKAIARTQDPEAVKKVERILAKLEEDYSTGKSRLRPDVTTASSVINAAAYYAGGPEGRYHALEIALRTFRKITDWGQEPNNITFGTLLKAVSNLLLPHDPQRDILTRQLFDQCCERGYVDGFVLAQLRQASPHIYYRELVDEPCGLGGPNADTSISSVLRNIPSDWSANVIE